MVAASEEEEEEEMMAAEEEEEEMIMVEVDEELLPGIFAMPHATLDAAHLVVAQDWSVLIGVPAQSDELLALVRAETSPDMMVVTARCEDAAAQLFWLEAFPEMQRVVHRMDAGRGALRRESDWLLSAGNDALGRAELKFTPADADDDEDERQRTADDGPWLLKPLLRARWTPGPTNGHVVLHYEKFGGILFSGRLCGVLGDDFNPFAFEDDHAVEDHVCSLELLADDKDFNFEWVLPARGRAIKFKDPEEAREGLRFAVKRAELLLGDAQEITKAMRE